MGNKKIIYKKCLNCGKEFISKNKQHKYCSICSPIMRKKHKHEYDKIYNLKHKEHKKEMRKIYYQNNKDKIKIINDNWKSRNLEKVREYKLKYTHSNKYKDNRNKSKNKISQWCRSQVRRCLSFKDNIKNKDKHTFDILGYTPLQLKQRLEFQFKNGMTWDNHGTVWHIDHKKPLSLFNFELPNGEIDYKQVRLANSLANLQPLFIFDNISKGNKFIL